jgi:hypothetical protein
MIVEDVEQRRHLVPRRARPREVAPVLTLAAERLEQEIATWPNERCDSGEQTLRDEVDDENGVERRVRERQTSVRISNDTLDRASLRRSPL